MRTKTKIEGKFYPLTTDVARKVRLAKLTAAEWRIWSYLVEMDPWGERYQDLEVLTVMSECSVSKATLYRAFVKLENLELFDFQEQGFSFKNSTGVSKMRPVSQICDSSLKNETVVSEMKQVSQICENPTPEPLPDKLSDVSQTIQITTDLIQTFQKQGEGEKVFLAEKNPDNEQQSEARESNLPNLVPVFSILNSEKLKDKNCHEDGFSAYQESGRTPVSKAHLGKRCDPAPPSEVGTPLREPQRTQADLARECRPREGMPTKRGNADQESGFSIRQGTREFDIN